MKTQRRFTIAGSLFPLLAVLVALCIPCRLTAQLDRGEVTGTVEDPSGAVVQNATIVLTNDDTNAKITSKSTATGTYVFDDIIPGKYTIQAEAPGFQRYLVHNVLVHVQQVATVDVKFATGNVQQTVTVTAAAPLLESENAQVGQSISNQSVNDMPLATRDWGSLAQMSAGVSTTPTGTGGSGVTPDAGSSESAYFRVNGVDEWQNDFRLNGINDNIEIYGGNYTGTNAAIVPPPDAIQEFTLQSGDFNAEFGHSTGGVVNASIKSGTNGIHGDAWEYVRNNDLNANYFFNRACSNGVCKANPIPPYHQNLFGFTAGGPVVIPGVVHGKNRLFWFADYQGGRYVLPVPDGNLTVPSKGMVSSNFTNLQDNIAYNYSGTCSATVITGCKTDALNRVFSAGTIMDPASTRQLPATGTDPVTGLTGTPNAYVRDPFYNCTAGGNCTSFVGLAKTDFTQDAGGVPLSALNVIPTSREDQNAVKLLSTYPAATASGLANDFQGYVPSEPKNTNTWDVRIDANISPKDILFGVYDRSYLTAHLPSFFPGVASGQSGGRVDSLPAYAWAVGYTRILTPTLTNDMHVGMVHSDKDQVSVWGNIYGSSACSGTVTTSTTGCNIPLAYGIQGVPQVQYNGGLPIVNISGLRGLGVGNFSPTIQAVWSLEGVDGVTKLYRNHAFKTGIQVDDLEADISQPPQGRGDMSFNGQYTDIYNKNASLNGISDLLVTPTNYEYGVGSGVPQVGGQNGISASNIAATDDHRWYIGAYFQDDWKFNPRLTLNLGLRWDLFTPYAETRGFQANFVAAGGNGASGTYYMSNQGCAVARASIFNTVAAASNLNINCVSSLTLGNAQKTNLAPRVGFAYKLRPTLVVRGGFGTAYGALGNLGYGGTLGFNYPFVYVQTVPSSDSAHPLLVGAAPGSPATLENTFNQFNFQNPSVLQSPTPYTSAPVACPYCPGGQYIGTNYLGLPLSARQYNYQTPLVQTENLTVEDQFTSHDAIQVGYVGTQGRHLDILGATNSNNEILPPGTNTQLYIPFPYFQRNSTYNSTNANSSYNSMQATYQHQMSFGLSLLANYTWSRCSGDQHAPQNSQFNSGYRAQWLPGFGIRGDYGLCDADATDLWHAAATYNLPFGRGRQFGSTMNKAADLIVGGWEINGFYTFESGQPLTVTCPTSTSADFGCAANVVSGQNFYAGPHNFTQWLNPGAFAQPPAATTIGQVNYAPLGGQIEQVRGPHFNNLDSSILKNFNFTESAYLQFRAEAFNTTNTPPLAQPGQLNFQAGSFSNISATKNSNQNNGARTLQLALKMFF
ncbi:TonB-dependent receptor plug [Candidatus Sulfotelmatomonas gaucii]|uniref:TonB-dependent receptor plug n=1 Tax=Candidatus Sulfuritelmatomonas gaucii TaxID=2043161 RepID=A0A2N9LV78_9BACT|nr:TonB-dependent receptor plug [Candidatus Sulfotelmatomonas gaucii]